MHSFALIYMLALTGNKYLRAKTHSKDTETRHLLSLTGQTVLTGRLVSSTSHTRHAQCHREHGAHARALHYAPRTWHCHSLYSKALHRAADAPYRLVPLLPPHAAVLPLPCPLKRQAAVAFELQMALLAAQWSDLHKEHAPRGASG